MSHSEKGPEPLTSPAWLFQAIKDRYDLKVEMRPGRVEPWWVTRRRDELRPADTALLWQAGSEAGIYGIGRLESSAYQATIEGDEGWWVDIRDIQLLDEPILKSNLREHPLLRRLEVIVMPHAGNAFRVSESESRAIRGLMGLP